MAVYLNDQRLLVVFIIGYITSSAINIQIASAWSLEKTGQYLGTQNQNGQHLLLFKLPESISSQIQGKIQYQQPNQFSTSWPNDPMQQEASLNLEQPISSLYEDQRPKERSIALTIPLSDLTSSSRLQSQAPVSEPRYRPSFYERSEHSAFPVRLSHYSSSPVVIDYLATDESNNNQVKDNHQVESHQFTNVKQDNYLQNGQSHPPQRLEQLSKTIHHKTAANLSSAIEQTVRHYLQQQADYSSTTMIAPTTTLPADTSTSPEFHYHVDPTTQVAILQQAEQQHEQQNIAEQAGQHHHGQKSQQFYGAGLLSRLANSSPDLLLRLRGFLRQAAGEGKNSTELHYLRENNFSHPVMNQETMSGLESGHQGLENSQAGGSLKGPYNGSDSMLSTFLTSHNLSSHEEIKIPLVVIAMPRILSLKRNQLATSNPGLSNSSVSLLSPSLIKQVLSPVTTNLTQAHAINNGARLGQLSFKGLNETNPEGNYTENSSTVSSQNVNPYSYLSGEQQIPMSSAPRHTMAPYARQFAVTAITPTVHQLDHNSLSESQFRYGYPPSPKIKQHPQMVNLTKEYFGASPDGSQHSQQQQQQKQQQQQGNRFIYPEIATMATDRHNTTGQILLIPTGTHLQSNSPEQSNIQMVQLVEQPQEQQPGYLNFIHQTQMQPNPIANEYMAHRGLQPQFKHAVQQDNFQIAEQQAQPSRSPYKIIKPANEQAPPRQKIIFAEHQEYPQVPSDELFGKFNTSSSAVDGKRTNSPSMFRNRFTPDNALSWNFVHPHLPLDQVGQINSRSLRPEFNLNRLRPLFHIARHGLNSHLINNNNEFVDQSISNKLLNRHLLGLLDQRADRRSSARSWTLGNGPESLQNPDELIKADSKKAPKMMVMIV